MIANDKLIEGLTYVRDILNSLPVTGVENCQKIINATININVTIGELQQRKDEPSDDSK